MTKRRDQRQMMRAAYRAPTWLREIAMTKPPKKRRRKTSSKPRYPVRHLVKDGVPQ